MKLHHKCKNECYLKINYDRKLDKVYFVPCYNLKPKQMIEPFAFNSSVFLDNIELCISRFVNFDLTHLQKYYFGTCECSFPYINMPCNQFVMPKKLNNISLSISSICNLRCPMCHKEHDYNYKEAYIYTQAMVKLLDFDQTDSLTFTANGEPFFFKKEMYNFIENSKIQNFFIITNGMMINSQDISELCRLNQKKRINIIVSLDGFNQEIIEKIRPKANLNKILDIIKLLKNAKLLNKCHYVATSVNKIEHNCLDKLFEELGVNYECIIDTNSKTYDYSDNIIKKFKKLRIEVNT
jgi:MoaA/NifB/PqqE/SkfB family radical SAM enzyme